LEYPRQFPAVRSCIVEGAGRLQTIIARIETTIAYYVNQQT
jgi:hypothetical protein